MGTMRLLLAGATVLLLGCGGEPTWPGQMLAGNWVGELPSGSQPMLLRLTLREPRGSRVTVTGEFGREILSFSGFDTSPVPVLGTGRVDDQHVSFELSYVGALYPVSFRFTGTVESNREIRGHLHDFLGVGTVRPLVLTRAR